MALDPKSLGRDDTLFDGSKRICVHKNERVKVAAIAGAPELPVGYPLQESATLGTYEPWQDGSEIAAITAHEPQATSAAGECLVVVMIRGEIHFEDVELPAGATQGALDTALRSAELNKRGIIVREITDKSL